ncbi:hypothetical protein A2866_05245 [Candidatus Roizmanbacteria bacterium RIFCSPHIGHO2_01_FULL_39_8]|uniref:OmpR/PhoB-type domain-containing protein n=3 Tax=Candidatus Roizmaniibacteriota TaxID=1752723 RepID=A0A1F7GJP9_9BACT|nr:MAG: hypothetical protein A2866_05245 [Candidatus Roizmanbacteria bacterium RIFCSPHIGHO2_01_FULL_39_8]OGK28614.1 MAG: hypothetical protein A3C28_03105 [Candidatus Roizmanbacteria bacterium RIFCSPHIGHO2_02_FULL_39_9]OGK36058.1 MAG: hypothetical protein A3F60_04050 [Candidatus Roizmanbacteria bacterium RIFCSPHIGHO2_12_FULL_39_8]
MGYAYFVPSGFSKFAQRIFRILRSDEIGVILFTPKMDRPIRVNQLIQDYQKEYPLVKVDLAPGHTNDLNYILPPIEQAAKKKKNMGICVTNCELMIYERNYQVIEEIAKLQQKQSHHRFLLFFEIDITHPDIARQFSLNEVFNNIVYYPLYEYKDTLNFIDYSLKEWKMELSKSIKNNIIQECGGQFWLVRRAVRTLRDDPEMTLEQIFETEQIRFRLEQIYLSLLDSEKKVLQKVMKQEEIEDPVEKHSLNYLNRMGYIRDGQITVPLLEQYMHEHLPKISLLQTGEHIVLNNVNIEGNFSKKEVRVLRLLLEQKNRVVSRDLIAKAIWPVNTSDSYTDWALDRFIARIRVKLKSLGVSKNLIKTFRSRGYMLSGSSSS